MFRHSWMEREGILDSWMILCNGMSRAETQNHQRV